MAKILITGVLTLDYIFDLAEFPTEDKKFRASAMRSVPGGNAANIARLLAQAGHQVELVAQLSEGEESRRQREELAQQNVGTQFCRYSSGFPPTSLILRSAATGSRTIIHHRNLEEFDPDHFAQIPLEHFDWFHFEGRNVPALLKMVAETHHRRIDQTLSVEFEKPRAGLSAVLPWVDLAMFSREWAESIHPHSGPQGFIDTLRDQEAPPLATLAWGSKGAWMVDSGQVYHHCREVLQPRDSLGAGDTFNAGLIHALVSGMPSGNALHLAVEKAATKLMQEGLEQLFTDLSDT